MSAVLYSCSILSTSPAVVHSFHWNDELLYPSLLPTRTHTHHSHTTYTHMHTYTPLTHTYHLHTHTHHLHTHTTYTHTHGTHRNHSRNAHTIKSNIYVNPFEQESIVDKPVTLGFESFGHLASEQTTRRP